MIFVSATDGGVESGGVITWTDLPNLQPNQTETVSIELEIVDFTQRAYLNHAHISDDSAADYGIDPDTGILEEDVDSDPNNFDGNDNGPGIDTPVINEDDDDSALVEFRY